MKKKLLTSSIIKRMFFIAAVMLPAALLAQDSSLLTYEPGRENINITYTNNTAWRSGSNTEDLKFSTFPRTSKLQQWAPMNVFPNPAISEATIVFNSHENGIEYNMVMLSSDGKPLLAKKGSTVYGTNLVKLDVQGFPTGFYYIQLTTKNGRQIMKLAKNVK